MDTVKTIAAAAVALTALTGCWIDRTYREPLPLYSNPIEKSGIDHEHEEWLRRFRRDYHNPSRWRTR